MIRGLLVKEASASSGVAGSTGQNAGKRRLLHLFGTTRCLLLRAARALAQGLLAEWAVSLTSQRASLGPQTRILRTRLSEQRGGPAVSDPLVSPIGVGRVIYPVAGKSCAVPAGFITPGRIVVLSAGLIELRIGNTLTSITGMAQARIVLRNVAGQPTLGLLQRVDFPAAFQTAYADDFGDAAERVQLVILLRTLDSQWRWGGGTVVLDTIHAHRPLQALGRCVGWLPVRDGRFDALARILVAKRDGADFSVFLGTLA